MHFQAAILLLMVTSLSHYVDCAVVGECQKGVRCNDQNLADLAPLNILKFYNVFEDLLNCTTTSELTIAGGSPGRCPTANAPQCYGGKVGISAGSTIVGSGPCLPVPECKAAGSFPAEFQGKRACQAYYDCIVDPLNSTLFESIARVCSGEREFNNVTKVCEPASTANCSTALAPTTATPAPVTNATANATVSVSSNVTASVTVASVAPTATVVTTVAPPTCSGWGKLPDPNSCRHFYKCGVFGRRSRKRCLFNLRFDVDANACRRNAACGTRPLVSA